MLCLSFCIGMIVKDFFNYTNTVPIDYNAYKPHTKIIVPHKKKRFTKLNINEASAVELMDVPSIGKKTAKKIICFRGKKKFKSVREITKIKGIGLKRYEKIKKYLFVKN
ncbi:helix-hairpin-helix domain-containing protein [bacterium]|nr:helix-hairpin-helix domain-containing protein [bacterium]